MVKKWNSQLAKAS